MDIGFKFDGKYVEMREGRVYCVYEVGDNCDEEIRDYLEFSSDGKVLTTAMGDRIELNTPYQITSCDRLDTALFIAHQNNYIREAVDNFEDIEPYRKWFKD